MGLSISLPKPFALDQTAEREQLHQVLPKFKELRKQQKG